jgi:parvulin-like peptidyl-prolyl isomerase
MKNISSAEIIQQVKFSGQMPKILEAIATREKITAAATSAGLEVDDSELQAAADLLRLANKLHQAQDTYAWLQRQQLTQDEFEEMVYFSVLSSKLAQHLFADRVEPYFVEHQLDYWQVVLYEVILEDEDLAQELYFAIIEREMSFFEVAQKYIKETELRRKCGYRGLLKRTDLKPEISATVFAATDPQLLKPILTAKGVHLILVDEIIQPALNQTVKQNIILELFSNWLQSQVEVPREAEYQF